jgi:hypothetical protein
MELYVHIYWKLNQRKMATFICVLQAVTGNGQLLFVCWSRKRKKGSLLSLVGNMITGNRQFLFQQKCPSMEIGMIHDDICHSFSEDPPFYDLQGPCEQLLPGLQPHVLELPLLRILALFRRDRSQTEPLCSPTQAVSRGLTGGNSFTGHRWEWTMTSTSSSGLHDPELVAQTV